MPGIAVRFRDRAGGVQLEQKFDWFTLETAGLDGSADPVVTVGDTVAGHDDPPHKPAPAMVEGEDWFTVDGVPVCRAEHLASCGHRTTGRHWFQLESADGEFRNNLTNPGDPCNIEHIPWIMRANGWHLGAKLMDQWFSRDASTLKLAKDADTTSVTMDFVLELIEARRAYDELMNESLWSVPNGNPNRRPIDRLCDQLADRGLLTRVPQTFDFELPVWKMKGRQIDNRVIRDSSLFIHDAHGAALGVFELLLVVAGDVNPLPDGSHQVIVRKKGVFMEDQYDFEGDQSFGYWNIGNHTASTVPNSVSYCPEVTNETFRRWREENNRGGDYFVYSDLRQVTLTTPYVFYCPTGPGPV